MIKTLLGIFKIPVGRQDVRQIMPIVYDHRGSTEKFEKYELF